MFYCKCTRLLNLYDSRNKWFLTNYVQAGMHESRYFDVDVPQFWPIISTDNSCQTNSPPEEGVSSPTLHIAELLLIV